VQDLLAYLDQDAPAKNPEPEASSKNGPRLKLKSSLRSLAPEFIDRLRASDNSLRDAIRQSDFSALRIFGHNLKGNGANFGFPVLSELGDRMESAALRNELGPMEALIGELRQYLDSVVIEYE